MTCRTVSAGQLAWTLCPSGLRGVDSSSTSASCVGSNPTGVIHDRRPCTESRNGWTNGGAREHRTSLFLPFFLACYYLFISFALPRSLSLSILLSLALSHYLSLSVSCSCCPLCHPGHVFHSPACSAASELHGCMSSERHTRAPLQFDRRLNHDAELLASSIQTSPSRRRAAPHYNHWAHGVVVSHPLRMWKALGSNRSVSIISPAPRTAIPAPKHNTWPRNFSPRCSPP